MPNPTRSTFFDITSEQGLLRTSIAVTLFIATIGIAFGLASGSFSIVFDGVYSLVDASMSGLSLVVVKLITSHTTSVQMSRKLRERFTMGFWHLEPMVLALNGILLSGVAIYALINAVSSLLEGGRHLEFGIAMVYAVLTVITCVTIAVVEARANRKLKSDFVRMDVKGWVMSASITAALLIAFCFGYAVQGTSLEWVSPYIDPAVLALVCLVIIPLPLSVVRQALSEIFLVTPATSSCTSMKWPRPSSPATGCSRTAPMSPRSGAHGRSSCISSCQRQWPRRPSMNGIRGATRLVMR